MENNDIYELCELFGVQGEIVGVSILSSGHINSTFKVDVDENGTMKSYIVQKVNDYVFKKPEELMENIISVTDFIEKKKGSGKTLKFLKTSDGKGVTNIDGEYFRIYEFVQNTETYDITENPKIIYETGLAFGEFQQLLSDYPASTLYETIPNFHNTINRFKNFETAVENNFSGRAESVAQTIVDYLTIKDTAIQMTQMSQAGVLPQRVTHNDTKCNNVLFDTNTKKHTCVIDLDTVMPGLAGFDFGDAIRFIANTATEDEKDLSKVMLDLGKFEAFTKGFVDGCGESLTKEEIETLPLGAITMTAECGVRFLTDYIDGDRYFKINYPEHNLDRALCQLKLAQDMIAKQDEMQAIVQKCLTKKELQ
ncbi:MAG: aminoglycoside phosphotransferase family protein [Clostridia bacterium]|nr:aminoglycoside phosphotransferase family protein [Clostridia bacterium]